jgi:hypothetical protein
VPAAILGIAARAGAVDDVPLPRLTLGLDFPRAIIPLMDTAIADDGERTGNAAFCLGGEGLTRKQLGLR